MEPIQPLCPIRNDAHCMGAPCALSLRHVRDDGVWVFSCALAGDGEGRAVIDERGDGARDAGRTWA